MCPNNAAERKKAIAYDGSQGIVIYIIKFCKTTLEKGSVSSASETVPIAKTGSP